MLIYLGGTDQKLSALKLIHGKADLHGLLFSKENIFIWDVGKVSTDHFFSLLLGIPILYLATSLTCYLILWLYLSLRSVEVLQAFNK